MLLSPALKNRIRLRSEQTSFGLRVVASLHPNPATVFGEVSISTEGMIYNFRVKPAVRGNGIASLLMRYAINAAPRAPQTSLYLTALADAGGLEQKSLLDFYRRYGFFATGVVMKNGAIEMRLAPSAAPIRNEIVASPTYEVRLEATRVGLKSKIAANEKDGKSLTATKEYYERLVKENRSSDLIKTKLDRVKRQIKLSNKEHKELVAQMDRVERAIKRASKK